MGYKKFVSQYVGKKFTSDGENEWKMIWAAQAGELADTANEITYQMKNQDTGEILTQLVFSLQKEQ